MRVPPGLFGGTRGENGEPPGDRRSGSPLAAVVGALVAVLVLGGAIGYALRGSPAPVRAKAAVATVATSTPSPFGPPGRPLALRQLGPARAIRGTIAMQALAPTLRLTLNLVSRLRYGVYLYSYPDKVEELFASAPGRAEFIRRMSIAHLVGYRRLIVDAQIPWEGNASRRVLEIPTLRLVREVMR
jgi:hypothetical protein